MITPAVITDDDGGSIPPYQVITIPSAAVNMTVSVSWEGSAGTKLNMWMATQIGTVSEGNTPLTVGFGDTLQHLHGTNSQTIAIDLASVTDLVGDSGNPSLNVDASWDGMVTGMCTVRIRAWDGGILMPDGLGGSGSGSGSGSTLDTDFANMGGSIILDQSITGVYYHSTSNTIVYMDWESIGSDIPAEIRTL